MKIREMKREMKRNEMHKWEKEKKTNGKRAKKKEMKHK